MFVFFIWAEVSDPFRSSSLRSESNSNSVPDSPRAMVVSSPRLSTDTSFEDQTVLGKIGILSSSPLAYISKSPDVSDTGCGPKSSSSPGSVRSVNTSNAHVHQSHGLESQIKSSSPTSQESVVRNSNSSLISTVLPDSQTAKAVLKVTAIDSNHEPIESNSVSVPSLDLSSIAVPSLPSTHSMQAEEWKSSVDRSRSLDFDRISNPTETDDLNEPDPFGLDFPDSILDRPIVKENTIPLEEDLSPTQKPKSGCSC